MCYQKLSQPNFKTASHEEILRGGDLEVNVDARRVMCGGEPLTLTPTELKLLVALMRRAGEAVSPEELVREVWGDWSCAPLRLASSP